MATGAEFAAYKNKMLIGFQDLGERAIGYLTRSHRESVQAKWDRDGVFNVRLELTGTAAYTVEVSGTSKTTDGLGHLFDVEQISSASALFESASGVTYYVGFFYAEVPLSIRLNPRTGAPEYTGYREEIGRSAAPTTVVSNVNATLTFKVNSVTEAGVSNAGRKVLVFRKIPAEGAISTGVAIEECTVAFVSGDNTITTLGTLGQSTVSTLTSDYTVVLMGMSVLRNTDLRATTGCFFVGTVTGAGADIPVDTDNGEQFLFKTFEDASQIAYIPSEWLTAINVQDAIDQLVGGLANTLVGVSGDTHIGVWGDLFQNREINLSEPMTTQMGGIGNVSDGTLPASPKLSNVLDALDETIRRIRVFTATVGDGSRPSDKDAMSGPNDATTQGGAYFFRRLNNAASVSYLVTDASTASVDVSPYILGESSSPIAPSISLGFDRTLIEFYRSDHLQYIPPGKYQRVFLDAAATSESLFVNGDGVAPGGIFEDVLVRGGNFTLKQMDVERGDGAVQFRNSVFDPITGVTHATGATLLLSDSGVGKPVHGHFENVIFYGPTPEQTTPAPVACVHLFVMGATNHQTDRPLTFDNCVFIGRRTDIPVLFVEMGHRVVFNHCVFIGMDGGLEPVVVAHGGNCIFNSCLIFAPEGQAIDITESDGALSNCQVTTGSNGSIVANPVAVHITGGYRGFHVSNLSVFLDSSAVRTSVATNALVVLGSRSSEVAGNLSVSGLFVTYAADIGLHNAETIVMYGNSQGGLYSDVALDCSGNTRTSSGLSYGDVVDQVHATAQCVVSVVGTGPTSGIRDRAFVRGLKVENYTSASGGLSSVVGVAHATVDSIVTRGTKVSGSGFASAVTLGIHGVVLNYCVADAEPTYSVAILRVIGDYARCCGFTFTDNVVGTGRVIRVDGNHCEICNVSIVTGNTIIIQVYGDECLVADGTITSSANVGPIALLGSRNIVRGMRGTWNATTESCVRTPTGTDNLVIGNVFARSAGTQPIAVASADVVVANNIPA